MKNPYIVVAGQLDMNKLVEEICRWYGYKGVTGKDIYIVTDPATDPLDPRKPGFIYLWSDYVGQVDLENKWVHLDRVNKDKGEETMAIDFSDLQKTTTTTKETAMNATLQAKYNDLMERGLTKAAASLKNSTNTTTATKEKKAEMKTCDKCSAKYAVKNGDDACPNCSQHKGGRGSYHTKKEFTVTCTYKLWEGKTLKAECNNKVTGTPQQLGAWNNHCSEHRAS